MQVSPLRIIREKRGLTRQQVALAVNLDNSHYGRIEKNEARASAAKAEEIANFFNREITEEQILYPERYPIPEIQKAS